MKIGILSDTHITKEGNRLIDLLDTHLKEVDFIIHAGDYTSHRLVRILKDYRNFAGVWGNADEPEAKNLLKEKEVIILEGYKIGIFHGHGKGSTTFNRAYEEFIEDEVDIIVFGHSHQPLVRTKNGILMLNPGSIKNKRQERWFSYIILELHFESIDVQLKFFSK